MAERKQARVAEQQIEPERGDGIDQPVGEQLHLIEVDEPRQGHEHDENGYHAGDDQRRRGSGARRLVSPSSRPPEQPGRLDQQDDGRDQIEHRELDLGKELDAGRAHEAHDQCADQCALKAAEPADDDHDEGEDQRVDAHAEHGRLRRHDDGAAEAGHEAAEGEGLHVDPLDVQAECRGHAHVLRRGAQDDAELRAIDDRPKEDGGRDADDDDDEIVDRISQVHDPHGSHAVHDRACGERHAPEQEMHDVLEDQQQAERDEELIFLRPTIERPQQRRLDHCADGGDGDCAEGSNRNSTQRGAPAANVPMAQAVT